MSYDEMELDMIGDQRNLKKRKMRMISRKVWKQVDWKKFRMRKSLKTKILKKMKNK